MRRGNSASWRRLATNQANRLYKIAMALPAVIEFGDTVGCWFVGNSSGHEAQNSFQRHGIFQ